MKAKKWICCILCFIYYYSFSAEAQLIRITSEQGFQAESWQVERSIFGKDSCLNTIVYSTTLGTDLFLVKDSLTWKGYIFKNVRVLDVLDPNDKNPIKTVVYQFDGDSLQKFLLSRGIYSLKQLNDKKISTMFTKSRTKKKDVKYILGRASHDIDISITTTNTSFQKKTITYPASFIDNKGLHFIPTIKIFFLFGKIMKDY